MAQWVEAFRSTEEEDAEAVKEIFDAEEIPCKIVKTQGSSLHVEFDSDYQVMVLDYDLDRSRLTLEDYLEDDEIEDDEEEAVYESDDVFEDDEKTEIT